jgi:hypothetical protein
MVGAPTSTPALALAMALNMRALRGPIPPSSLQRLQCLSVPRWLCLELLYIPRCPVVTLVHFFPSCCFAAL